MKTLARIWWGIKTIPKRPRTVAALLLPLVLATVTYAYLQRGESLPTTAAVAVEATPIPEVFLPSSAVEENRPPEISGLVVSPEITGDVNGDGQVNLFDLTTVAGSYDSESEDSPADLNGDGVVNLLDLVIVANAYSTE